MVIIPQPCGPKELLPDSCSVAPERWKIKSVCINFPQLHLKLSKIQTLLPSFFAVPESRRDNLK
jgi:hypothetical protein